MIAIPRAWTGSTPGKKSIKENIILIKAKDSAELYQNYAGKIKDKTIMIWSPDTLKPSFTADGSRFTEEELEKMANAKLDTSRRPQQQASNLTPEQLTAMRQRQALTRQMTDFYKTEKPCTDPALKDELVIVGGIDHQAFDGVGIPGFQFIQDEIEYDTRTHHTNMDTYDHLVPADLAQASTIIASFVYNTTQLDGKIPRKELPKPRGNVIRGF